MAEINDIPHDAPFAGSSLPRWPPQPRAETELPSPPTVAQRLVTNDGSILTNSNDANSSLNDLNNITNVRDSNRDNGNSTFNGNANANSNNNQHSHFSPTPLADPFTDTDSADHTTRLLSQLRAANLTDHGRADLREANLDTPGSVEETNIPGNPDTPHAHINISVQSENNSMRFKVRATTKLGKLMSAYCERQGLDQATARFLFDGMRVESGMTPESLEMEDGDSLEVRMEQIGG